MEKPRRHLVPALAILVVFGVLGFAGAFAAEHSPGGGAGVVTILPITFGEKTIQAVVADTDKSRGRGLLGWDTISEEQGMLLDFLREVHYAIHMETMNFPIDALWIDTNGSIRVIYEEIVPNSGLSYPSLFPCRYCLEVKAGFCKKYGVKMGQQVQFGEPRKQSR